MNDSEYWRSWYQRNKERYRGRRAELMRKYRAQNPEKCAEQSRNSKRRIRIRILDTFGRTCSICGFSDERALTLDHVKNNGAKERMLLGERGVYRRALKSENRSEYRILCMNCQFIARHEAGRQNQHAARPKEIAAA